MSAIAEVAPTEVYDLAAQGLVSTSWRQPGLTAELTRVAMTRFLEAMPSIDEGNGVYQAARARLASGSVDAGTAVPPA